MPLLVKRLHKDAKLPVRKSYGAAGYDVYSVQEVTLEPNEYKMVPTGIAMTVPDGTYGQLAPRSGLASKGVHVGAGVVDIDFTGEVKVLLINLSTIRVSFEKHERISQLILHKIEIPEVEEVTELGLTIRGDHGFGSTGKS